MWPQGCWTPGWLAPLSLPVISGPSRKVETMTAIAAKSSRRPVPAWRAAPASGPDVMEEVRGDAGERAPGGKQRAPRPPGGASEQTGTDPGLGERAHCGALPLAAAFAFPASSRRWGRKRGVLAA